MGILLKIQLSPMSVHTVSSKRRTVFWNYRRADFEKANQLLSDVDWNSLFESGDINFIWDCWKKKFFTVMEECIPKTSCRIPTSVPWMSCSIIRKIRKRNSVYKKFRLNSSPALWNKYKRLRNETVNLIRSSRRLFISSLQPMSKPFWK